MNRVTHKLAKELFLENQEVFKLKEDRSKGDVISDLKELDNHIVLRGEFGIETEDGEEGYFTKVTSKEAKELFLSDQEVFKLYDDGTEGVLESLDGWKSHNEYHGEYGVEFGIE